MKGDKAKQEVPARQRHSAGASLPPSTPVGGAKVVPLAAVRRVEVAPGNTSVKFVPRAWRGQAPARSNSWSRGTPTPEEIARRAGAGRAAGRSGRGHHGRRGADASGDPRGAIIQVVWSLLPLAAVGLEEGEEAHVRGGGRGRGIKVLFVIAAQLLGKTRRSSSQAVLLALFVY